MKKGLILCSIIFFLPFAYCLPSNTQEKSSGNISFQPNIIDSVNVHFVEEFFRFQWLGNRFDLKLTIGYNDTDRIKELSLRDFWEKTEHAMKWKEVLERASIIEFGYNITDIPQEYADRCLYLLWKIEDATFTPKVEDNNSTFLNDNLYLSYEDLLNYGFHYSYLSNYTVQVLNITGKTSWNLDPITYSPNIMTMTEFGTSGSWAANMFWEFWNASDANGWNVAENTTYGEDRQFNFGCRLQIGNGTAAGESFVYDVDVQVTFNSTAVSANNQELIQVTNSSHMRLGTLHDASDRTTSQGVKIIALDTYRNVPIVEGESGSEVLLYSFSCRATYTVRSHGLVALDSTTANFQLYNSECDNVYIYGNMEVYNIDMTRVVGFAIQTFTGSMERGTLMQTVDWAFYSLENSAFNVTNLIIRNTGDELFYAHRISVDKYLVDVDSDEWSINWVQASTHAIIRQYTFNLNVTEPDGTPIQWANVTVTHYGQAETEDFSVHTDATGAIAQQTLSMGFYNQTGGNIIYNYNPYNIQITNVTGYSDYSGNFTLNEQMEWTIILTEEGVTAAWYLALLAVLGLTCIPIGAIILIVRRKS